MIQIDTTGFIVINHQTTSFHVSQTQEKTEVARVVLGKRTPIEMPKRRYTTSSSAGLDELVMDLSLIVAA